MAWEACEGSKAAGVEQAAEVTLEGIGIGVGIVEVVLVATLCAVELSWQRVACWGKVTSDLYTTFNARTYLQPQLNKAAKSTELQSKGDRNPKDLLTGWSGWMYEALQLFDFILFTKHFKVGAAVRDNTGEATYKDVVFPTLEFPSDHAAIAADPRCQSPGPIQLLSALFLPAAASPRGMALPNVRMAPGDVVGSGIWKGYAATQAPIPFSSGLSTGAFPTTTFAQNFLATPHPGLRAAPPTGVQAAPSWSPPQAPPSDIVGEMREAVQKTDWYQLYQEGKTKFWMGGGWSAGPERCGLLQTLCALSGARRVVEIGQCCGVATLAMAEALPQGGKVVTLEIDSYLADFGKQYWARSSHGSKIRSVVGPAMEYLKSGNAKQDGPFDLAVIDADKDGIWDYYCTLRDQGLLAPKAAIVVDTTPYKASPSKVSADLQRLPIAMAFFAISALAVTVLVAAEADPDLFANDPFPSSQLRGADYLDADEGDTGRSNKTKNHFKKLLAPLQTPIVQEYQVVGVLDTYVNYTMELVANATGHSVIWNRTSGRALSGEPRGLRPSRHSLMSHDSSDDADDDDAADDMEELTPWDHSCGPPPAGGNDAALPRGPPVPMPVSGPPPTAARGSRDTPPDAASGSRDAATASWEYDHSSGPQPVVVLEADGTRRVARVAGPLTRSGRFRDSSDSSGSSSNDDDEDDEDDERDIRSPDGAADATDSGTWSETSLILEGPSLRDSKDRLCALYRQEVQDKAADEGCGLTSRSLAAQDDKSILPEQGRESLKKADWLRNDTAWTYLRWAPKQKRLVVDESREPLLHDEAVPVLSALQKAITGDIVTKFNSTVNLARLEEEGSQQAVFHHFVARVPQRCTSSSANWWVRPGANYDKLGKASDDTALQSYAAQFLAAHDWPQAAPAQQLLHERQVVLQASPLAGALEVQQQQHQQQQQLQLRLLQLQQLKALVESHLPSAGLQMPRMPQASPQEANLQADMASLTRSVTSLSEQLSRIEDQMHPYPNRTPIPASLPNDLALQQVLQGLQQQLQSLQQQQLLQQLHSQTQNQQHRELGWLVEPASGVHGQQPSGSAEHRWLRAAAASAGIFGMRSMQQGDRHPSSSVSAVVGLCHSSGGMGVVESYGRTTT
eukprot:s1835_g7.t2